MKNKKLKYHPEPHNANQISMLNWLRASVLGANDGIVSIAGLVMGVAGATNSTEAILTAGLAGIAAGAISMASGEYVSVSSSRDTEEALLRKEQNELNVYPEQELAELADIYEKKGLSRQTALTVAKELTAKDPFKAHVDAELGIDPENLTNPWHAAFASAASFLVGAVIPLIAILLPPVNLRIPVAFISVIFALAISGILSASAGGAHIMKATARIVIGGIIAMAVTYSLGRLFGTNGI